MALEKARLMEIDADEAAKVVPGTEIPVQFNPQTLKLSLANKLESQDTRGQQTRQYLGKTSTTLSFDLQFDTSDEGTTDAPVSVRSRTAAIERFVLPKGEGKQKQKPPKARFVWQDLQIDGIIEDLSIDFDLFASDGTPLRAKMSVTMKEQDAKYQAGKSGPGANSAAGVSLPGMSSAGPGSFSASVGLADSTRVALSGESAAEFASRNGVDPAAWRGVAGALDSTLSLKGGAEVDFNASISSAAGVGVAVGVEAGASASLEASFGLDARGAVPTPAGVALGAVGASAGFALASAGGVSAAIETVSSLKADGAAASTKDAFGESVATTKSSAIGTATPAPPDQSRAPLAITGLPSATAQAAAPPAPPPPVADPRATTFGFGVPLRPRITGATQVRRGALAGSIPLRPHERSDDVLTPASDPTAAPWTQLPADRSRTVADAAQRTRRPIRQCGCRGPCKHGASR